MKKNNFQPKKILFILLVIILNSCAQAVNEPKNLISQKEMSNLIAEFALADQMTILAPTANVETQTRFILKQHKIKAKDFQESYTYYTGTNKLDKIFSDAQETIFDKDPKAKDFIEKKLKDNPLLPGSGR
ncbi:DUF4296 domain-containing protein [Halpernia frigidisoli]|uniref:DUF4296 domain-containing protein n=1 Tax=Halpernia frigidisoli TaxID=1125876 RepID=UPI0015A55AE4|nr:DUF4296 domain-containing protein [Halpernia frigidisoli]